MRPGRPSCARGSPIPCPATWRRRSSGSRASDDVRRVAVMPDVHLAADVCVGTVVATGSTLYPNAVGRRHRLRRRRASPSTAEAAAPRRRAGRGAGARGALPRDPVRPPRPQGGRPPAPRPRGASAQRALRSRRARASEAAFQVGTLGSGNHFVELQADDDGTPLAHAPQRLAGHRPGDPRPPPRRRARPAAAGSASSRPRAPRAGPTSTTSAGPSTYAEANRRALVDAVLDVVAPALGVRRDESSRVSCNHNHVRRESHGGVDLWVHRKGAMSAAPESPASSRDVDAVLARPQGARLPLHARAVVGLEVAEHVLHPGEHVLEQQLVRVDLLVVAVRLVEDAALALARIQLSA